MLIVQQMFYADTNPLIAPCSKPINLVTFFLQKYALSLIEVRITEVHFLFLSNF